MDFTKETCILIVLIAGCAPPPLEPPPAPVLKPPQFNIGDLVHIKDDEAIAIIIEVHPSQDDFGRSVTWQYTTLTQTHQLKYLESELEIISRFDWNERVYVPWYKQQGLPKPEPETQKDIQPIEDAT